MVIITVDVII